MIKLNDDGSYEITAIWGEELIATLSSNDDAFKLATELNCLDKEILSLESLLDIGGEKRRLKKRWDMLKKMEKAVLSLLREGRKEAKALLKGK